MNRYKKTIAIVAGLVMLMSLSIVASAQRNNRRGNDDYYGNNTNISYAVKNLKNTSKNFEKALDRELDRSRYDGTQREDNLNDLAKQFTRATNDLEDGYNGGRNQRNSADEARRVMQLGTQLDRALTRSRIVNNNYSLQNSWSMIERDLQTIGRAYNYNYNGGYGRNRGNNRNDDRNNRNRGNNGRNNQNLRSTISNLKSNAQRLENRIDREYDNNDRNRNRRNNNNLENLANRFRDAVEKLEDEYDNRNDYNRSADEARTVLNIGQQLDRELSSSRVNSSIQSDWNRIESDLRVLANAYNTNYNGSNNRNSRWGGILDNLPF